MAADAGFIGLDPPASSCDIIDMFTQSYRYMHIRTHVHTHIHTCVYLYIYIHTYIYIILCMHRLLCIMDHYGDSYWMGVLP